MPSGLILGIESSCDETAAAVVRSGSEVLSNVVASQMQMHAVFGGVVPELASREHLRNIVPVVREAIAKAGIQFADLDAIAVTEGPGLAGALLVGITFAKALAFGLNKPLIAVNHLEGHIHAVLLEMRAQNQAAFADPGVREKILALVVSGGHTHLYLAHEEKNIWTYRNIGRTLDDAAGEAFDKVAKLLGFGYPGGPWIDALAQHGDARAVSFTMAQIKPKPHRASADTTNRHLDFSFSGIKTAVLRHVETRAMQQSIATRREALAKITGPKLADVLALCDKPTLDLIASFQRAVVDYLLRGTFAAAEEFSAKAVVVSGGVAANHELRQRFTAEAAKRDLPIAFPSLALATDNAAMIAAAAWPKLQSQTFATDSLQATAQLSLG
ncbi:MAG TPA: tRNA (adenosine(37)-N6)-threonylcarbamoyltransferase complex transferase subunit TsaD [Acidobacteriaceae bacterium]|nr:tRNA (adenosine(37)-N6)-threonylcarbamoyltransferase complex transferase subunit TsaD [Acidobacteriaceae bacterium]